MIIFAIAVMTLVADASPAAPPLSLEAAALIAPVHAAYLAVEQRQSALPSPKGDTERLVRLGEIDQAGRAPLHQINLAILQPDETRRAHRAMWQEIEAHDRADQTALKALEPAQGWFGKSRYGEAAVDAAFFVVQHAVNDKPWMQDVLTA